MLYRSHRGCLYYAPENTLPAFKIALDLGFDYIETDPYVTTDGVVVLMHDQTINRTCRNSDGSPIEKNIRPVDSTYEELLAYDAGIAMSEEFKGTKIPTLDQLLTLCEGKNVIVALDKGVPTDKLDALFDVVARHNVRCTFSCADTKRIKTVLARFPDAYIDYDGDTTDERLDEVCSLVKPENLLVWMYLDKPNFRFLTDRAKCSPENCKRTKRHARLGVANVSNPYDLKEALEYEPYCVEM